MKNKMKSQILIEILQDQYPRAELEYSLGLINPQEFSIISSNLLDKVLFHKDRLTRLQNTIQKLNRA